MLEYIKYILDKVSFDPHLFEKELIKNKSELLKEELADLQRWCIENFGTNYYKIIERCFL